MIDESIDRKRGEGWEGQPLRPHTRGAEPPNPLNPPPTSTRPNSPIRRRPMASDVRRQTYTVAEVAKILGIGRNTAYEVCRSGEIPTIRIGGRILVPCAALHELLDGAA